MKVQAIQYNDQKTTSISSEPAEKSEYVAGEMLALEQEQRKIDERAAQVEWELRLVMKVKDGSGDQEEELLQVEGITLTLTIR